jgi:hypothetical protein
LNFIRNQREFHDNLFKGIAPHLFFGGGTLIRTEIKGFGDPYSTIEICPHCNK